LFEKKGRGIKFQISIGKKFNIPFYFFCGRDWSGSPQPEALLRLAEAGLT